MAQSGQRTCFGSMWPMVRIHLSRPITRLWGVAGAISSPIDILQSHSTGNMSASINTAVIHQLQKEIDVLEEKGKVLQYVSSFTQGDFATTAVVPHDDTVPTSTEGAEYTTLDITPKSATSNLVIRLSMAIHLSVVNWVMASIFRDSAASAEATLETLISTATAANPGFMEYVVASGDTTARTYKVRVGPSAGNCQINRRLGLSQWSGISITEIEV